MLDHVNAPSAVVSPDCAGEGSLQMLDDAVGSAERAGDVDADDDFVAAVGALEVHRVEGRDGFDVAGSDLEDARDLGHGVRGDQAHARAGPPRAPAGSRCAHAGSGRGHARSRSASPPARSYRGPREIAVARRGSSGVGHRSTSPSTMSMEPMTATTSAISSPRTMCGSALRLLKDGARTLQRYGRLVPSLTR